jgi:hypothetical protein
MPTETVELRLLVEVPARQADYVERTIHRLCVFVYRRLLVERIR